jgi:hypothetical protein
MCLSKGLDIMIIINTATCGEKTYIISLGGDEYRVYANSEEQAIEFLTETLSHDWYFDCLSVELMAKSAHKSIEEFINATDLRYCPKYDVYLPKLKIQEVAK